MLKASKVWLSVNLEFDLCTGIFLSVLFVILLLIVLVLRKRISIAVKVIKEASKYVAKICMKKVVIPSILLWYIGCSACVDILILSWACKLVNTRHNACAVGSVVRSAMYDGCIKYMWVRCYSFLCACYYLRVALINNMTYRTWLWFTLSWVKYLGHHNRKLDREDNAMFLDVLISEEISANCPTKPTKLFFLTRQFWPVIFC